VLAVGDAEFQKKCLGKMQDVSTSEGRTVLFVSHNLMALSSLCNKGVYLRQGQMQKKGEIEEVLNCYIREGAENHLTEWKGNEGDEEVKIYRTKVYCETQSSGFYTHQPVVIEVEGEVLKPVYGMILGFWLYSQFDYQLAYTLFDDADPDLENKTHQPGRFKKRFVIPANTLAQGNYRVHFDFGIHNQRQIVPYNICDVEFSVENIAGLGRKYLIDQKGFRSLFRPAWSVEKYAR
jgi:lipopolysaccharide transport system ATP-binding protein